MNSDANAPIEEGLYVCEGELPIVVTDAGKTGKGPWISYRFEFEPDAASTSVLWTTFRELMDFGYAFDSVVIQAATQE